MFFIIESRGVRYIRSLSRSLFQRWRQSKIPWHRYWSKRLLQIEASHWRNTFVSKSGRQEDGGREGGRRDTIRDAFRDGISPLPDTALHRETQGNLSRDPGAIAKEETGHPPRRRQSALQPGRLPSRDPHLLRPRSPLTVLS